jgi:tetratricopeptide (TPR) repeat protein
MLAVGPADLYHLYDAHVQVPRPEHSLKAGLRRVLWMILFDWEAATLAALGTVHMAVRRRWLLVLVPGWCLAGVVVLTLHWPTWYHHYLLVSIPGCVIAGIAVAELFSQGYKPQRGWTYPARVVLRLTAAALTICLVVALIQGKKSEPVRSIDRRREHDRFALKVMNAFAEKTRMVITDRQMYAFRGGFTVPPNFCQTSRKRSLTGNLTVADCIEAVREHRPEQIVLARVLYPEARAILEGANDKYVLVYRRRSTTRIYVREDVANDWFTMIQELAKQTGHAPAHDFLALQWIERGEVERALSCLERAVALDPSEPFACTHLAEVYMVRGRYAEAFEVLATARHMADGHRYLELSRVYAWRMATCSEAPYRDAVAAEAVIDEVLGIYKRPRAEDLEIKAATVAAQGRYAEAVVAVTRAIERAKERGEHGRIERLERQLQSYRDGKPIVEHVTMPQF